MDDDSLELVKAVSEGIAEGTTEGVLRTLLAPFVEGGEYFADIIRGRRAERQIKMLTRALAMLDESGLAPGWVPAKTLVPLLEFAGLEDDEDMQERWAALLANAAVGDAGREVVPSFVRILQELSPPEAKMLDWLAGLPDGSPVAELMGVAGFTGAAREWRYPYDVYVENLERLGLTTADILGPHLSLAGPVDSPVRVSRLGAAFVAVCTPPAAESTDR